MYLESLLSGRFHLDSDRSFRLVMRAPILPGEATSASVSPRPAVNGLEVETPVSGSILVAMEMYVEVCKAQKDDHAEQRPHNDKMDGNIRETFVTITPTDVAVVAVIIHDDVVNNVAIAAAATAAAAAAAAVEQL